MLAGDYYVTRKDWAKAIPYYEKGLGKEIATTQEKEHMEKNLQICKDKLL
jgi:isopenicillin-N N-acyltransferase-like protein